MDKYARAFNSSIRSVDFNFDDKFYTIRRNLMVAASVSIASTFVNPPKNNGFEVNIGIIKGTIDRPEYVYVFILVVCIYYLVWFILSCRNSVVDNYNQILHQFISSHAASSASESFKKLNEKIDPPFYGSPSFQGVGGGGSKYTASAELTDHALRNYPHLIVALKESKMFFTEKKSSGLKINYLYKPQPDDYKYIDRMKDHFWRRRKYEMFITVLPIGYSLVSIGFLSYHLYCLVIG